MPKTKRIPRIHMSYFEDIPVRKFMQKNIQSQKQSEFIRAAVAEKIKRDFDKDFKK